jgi:hypothetical protein
MREALQLLRVLASEAAAAAAPRVLDAGMRASNALEALSVRLEAPDPRWADSFTQARAQYEADQQAMVEYAERLREKYAPAIYEGTVTSAVLFEDGQVEWRDPAPRYGLFQVAPGEMRPYIEALNDSAKEIADLYLRKARDE